MLKVKFSFGKKKQNNFSVLCWYIPDAPVEGANGLAGEVTCFCACVVGLCTLPTPVGLAAVFGLKGGAPNRSTETYNSIFLFIKGAFTLAVNVNIWFATKFGILCQCWCKRKCREMMEALTPTLRIIIDAYGAIHQGKGCSVPAVWTVLRDCSCSPAPSLWKFFRLTGTQPWSQAASWIALLV